jgi:hypothetical protein
MARAIVTTVVTATPARSVSPSWAEAPSTISHREISRNSTTHTITAATS